MASIRDVAKKANVAACTVSRVLNGTGYVSEDTKAKIQEAMKELNYIPNELARSMFRQKVGIIGMLVPDIMHPFFSTLARYMEEELYQRGYKLMLCSSANDREREREYMEMLRSNLVDGVILGVNNLEQEIYLNFNKPLVMLDRYVGRQIPVVVSDHDKGGRLAAQALVRNHCKYVIHITGEENNEVLSYQSHVSFEKELKKHGIETKGVPFVWEGSRFADYVKRAEEVLEAYPDADGVMAADMAASAFIRAAVNRGKRVPEDFKVVAYDGTYATDGSILSITTVVQQTDQLAKCAVTALEQRLNNQSTEKQQWVVDVFLKEGETA